MPVPPAIRNMIKTWYLTAPIGSAPARIWPVIMPGSAITPAADMALMIGIRPARSARRAASPSAVERSAPSARRASIATRSRDAVVTSESNARLTPVMVLPRIMPSSRIA